MAVPERLLPELRRRLLPRERIVQYDHEKMLHVAELQHILRIRSVSPGSTLYRTGQVRRNVELCHERVGLRRRLELQLRR